MVISLGQCYWPGKRVPQIPNCWSSCNVREKMRECGKGDDKGMVSDVEAMLTQGGREMLSSMRDGVCDCVMVVVVALVGGFDDSGGSSGVGDSGECIESIVYKSGGHGGSIVYTGSGEGLYMSG